MMILWRFILGSTSAAIGMSVALAFAMPEDLAAFVITWGVADIAMRPVTAAFAIGCGIMSAFMASPCGRVREWVIMLSGSMIFYNAACSTYQFVIKMPDAAADHASSWGTMLAFVMLGTAGIIRGVFTTETAVRASITVSRCAGYGVGGVALIGHAINLPILHWTFAGSPSVGMAVPTAVCLILCAAAVNGRSKQ